MRFKVVYKSKTIGEIFTCDNNQWGSYHYKTDCSVEGIENTTILSMMEDLVDFEIHKKDLKDFKLIPIEP